VLTAGLIALNAHLTAPVPVKPAMVRTVATPAAPPPALAEPEPVAAVAAEPTPQAPAKATSTRRSNKRHAGGTAR
jgi:hypothetical protein